MTNHIIEVVQFKLNSDIDESTFLEAAKSSSSFLKSCNGFVRRQLSKNNDGVWLDYVEWQTMDAAKKAAELFPSQKRLEEFISSIDMRSVVMKHNTLLITGE